VQADIKQVQAIVAEAAATLKMEQLMDQNNGPILQEAETR
jgi:hypothetical protein